MKQSTNSKKHEKREKIDLEEDGKQLKDGKVQLQADEAELELQNHDSFRDLEEREKSLDTVMVKKCAYIFCKLRKNSFLRVWLKMLSFLVCYFAENVCALFDHYGTRQTDLTKEKQIIEQQRVQQNEELENDWQEFERQKQKMSEKERVEFEQTRNTLQLERATEFVESVLNRERKQSPETVPGFVQSTLESSGMTEPVRLKSVKAETKKSEVSTLQPDLVRVTLEPNQREFIFGE